MYPRGSASPQLHWCYWGLQVEEHLPWTLLHILVRPIMRTQFKSSQTGRMMCTSFKNYLHSYRHGRIKQQSFYIYAVRGSDRLALKCYTMFPFSCWKCLLPTTVEIWNMTARTAWKALLLLNLHYFELRRPRVRNINWRPCWRKVLLKGCVYNRNRKCRKCCFFRLQNGMFHSPSPRIYGKMKVKRYFLHCPGVLKILCMINRNIIYVWCCCFRRFRGRR